MTLQKQVIQIPLSAGLDQKSDVRALAPPALAVCLDAQFTERGGLQTRLPSANIGTSILGGGTVTGWRRIVPYGDELVLFTADTLYSWNVQLSVWVPRGTHLAAAVSEQDVFATTADQHSAARAELGGVIVYAWAQIVASSQIAIAAIDKATGGVLMASTLTSTTLFGIAPRLVALNTRILLVYSAPAGIAVLAIDPANVATSVAVGGGPTVVAGTATSTRCDVCQINATDTAMLVVVLATNTSYLVATITAALTITTSTKARTADGIAVSCSPNGFTQVVRVDDAATNIVGDLLNTATLADVHTAQAIGSFSDIGAGDFINQIACAHQSVQQGGAYRCYVFWDRKESATLASWWTASNWVDTAGTLGTAAVFMSVAAPASRAFDYNGRVFLWMAFAGASAAFTLGGTPSGPSVQNAYFLLRDDGFIAATSVYESGGGFCADQNCLPGCAATAPGVYATALGRRRRIPVQSQPTPSTAYAERAPVDVVVTFDSNEARRTAQLGATLYVAAAEPLQYDGEGLNEVGFHVYPWMLTSGTATGTLPAGTWAYKATVKWTNAKGETERSTTATIILVTMAGTVAITIGAAPLHLTHKLASLPSLEFWRTLASAGSGAPFYLVTGVDPSVTTGNNCYVANDPTNTNFIALNDNLTDALAALNETNPENGSVLESIAPPACTIVAAGLNRLFLAGVAGQPNTVWYSKLRGIGEVVAFDDSLTFDVPSAAGPITALEFINETPIVFCASSCYAVAGQGFDNSGGGSNYGPPQLLSANIGCVAQESIARTPDGSMFKAIGGWYFVDQGLQLHYIGAPVTNYDDEDVVSVVCMDDKNEVRILSAERLLVWDYVANQWSEWSIAGGLDACVWQGQYVYLTSAGVMVEQPDYSSGVAYGMDAESPWIKLQDLQGFGRVWSVLIAGEYRGAHTVRVRIARNYQYTSPGVPAWFDDKTWTPSPTTIGSIEQVRHGPSIQQCEAIKIRITVMNADGVSACATEGMKLTGLALECGFKPGTWKLLPESQTQ